MLRHIFSSKNSKKKNEIFDENNVKFLKNSFSQSNFNTNYSTNNRNSIISKKPISAKPIKNKINDKVCNKNSKNKNIDNNILGKEENKANYNSCNNMILTNKANNYFTNRLKSSKSLLNLNDYNKTNYNSFRKVSSRKNKKISRQSSRSKLLSNEEVKENIQNISKEVINKLEKEIFSKNEEKSKLDSSCSILEKNLKNIYSEYDKVYDNKMNLMNKKTNFNFQYSLFYYKNKSMQSEVEKLKDFISNNTEGTKLLKEDTIKNINESEIIKNEINEMQQITKKLTEVNNELTNDIKNIKQVICIINKRNDEFKMEISKFGNREDILCSKMAQTMDFINNNIQPNK